MKNNYSYNVFWSDEDNAYIAVCPEFPGLSAFGDTPEEALEELQPVVQVAIEGYRENGWPLPQPKVNTGHTGKVLTRFPKSVHAALAAEAEREGVSQNMFIVTCVAEKLGMTAATRSIQDAVLGATNETLEKLAFVVDSVTRVPEDVRSTLNEFAHELSYQRRHQEYRLLEIVEENHRHAEEIKWIVRGQGGNRRELHSHPQTASSSTVTEDLVSDIASVGWLAGGGGQQPKRVVQ